MRALEIPTIDMSTPIRWRHDRPPRRRPRPEPRPLTLIKSALGEAARVALAEPFMLSVERQDIYLRRLPRALDGLRIIHLSDFHYGPLTDSRHLERAVQAANDLRPDLIALTGDYISHDRSYAAPCAELISRLRARHGVFAVLGNHDAEGVDLRQWPDGAAAYYFFHPPLNGPGVGKWNTPIAGEEWPTVEFLAAFKAQTNQELMDDVVAYIAKRATWLKHQHEDRVNDVILEMVTDALGDTFEGRITWEPLRCPLALHLN